MSFRRKTVSPSRKVKHSKNRPCRRANQTCLPSPSKKKNIKSRKKGNQNQISKLLRTMTNYPWDLCLMMSANLLTLPMIVMTKFSKRILGMRKKLRTPEIAGKILYLILKRKNRKCSLALTKSRKIRTKNLNFHPSFLL